MPFRKLSTVLLGCALALVLSSPAAAFKRLDTGIHEPGAGEGSATVFDRMNQGGSSIARTAVLWSSVAPNATAKPAGFDARNPADPQYNWATVDAFVRAAADRGMEPLLTTYHAPAWAEGDDDADRARRFGDTGAYHPNATQYGDFMFALATRYSGSFPDPANPGRSLPRVRYLQMWNEPNFGQYIVSRRKQDIPVYYAKLLNAGYDAVKSVSRSNLVLTGGMGPFGNNGHATDVDPQLFMRELFCLRGSGGRKLREAGGCNVPRPKFDVWTQHPYTFGGTPRTKAVSVDGASLGNMADVKRTLDFAVRRRNVSPSGRKRLWVTEFAFFSNPPGIKAGNGRELGAPLSRHAAYLSESAYRLWRTGFEAFVWYGLTDHAGFPSGLNRNGDINDPKPAFNAFQFPFYADASSRGVLFWGLVSRGGRTTVRIEKQRGSSFRRVADVRTDSQGMFYTRLRGSRGTYRARALNGAKSGLGSLPFNAR